MCKWDSCGGRALWFRTTGHAISGSFFLTEKSLLNYWPWAHNSWTVKRSNLPLNCSKPSIFISGRFSTVVCYSNHVFATVIAVLSLFYLFIFAEYLKNHSKSQKNHKIENLILLYSTWVNLHSEHIIRYALVQSFCCSFRLIGFFWFIQFLDLLDHIYIF
jgi:hypothetical protein